MESAEPVMELSSRRRVATRVRVRGKEGLIRQHYGASGRPGSEHLRQHLQDGNTVSVQASVRQQGPYALRVFRVLRDKDVASLVALRVPR